MKVCFIISDFKFMISHRYSLLLEMAKLHEVIVITDLQNVSHESIASVKSNKIAMLHLQKRAHSNVGDYLRYGKGLVQLINKVSPSHLFFVTLEISMMGGIMSRLLKVERIFYVISGLGNFFFYKKMKYKFMRLIYYLSFQVFNKSKSTKFIFQNKEDEKIFLNQKYIRGVGSMIIHGNGVVIPNIQRGPRKINANQLIFCFAGRLSVSKGFGEFITACKAIHRDYPGIKFQIAGSCSPDTEDFFSTQFYEEIKKNNIFTLNGELPHHAMEVFFKDADIFVLPSYREGLSKAALEAAANSLPLIVSDVPGLRECIKENGYMCRRNDAEDLTKKMLEIIKNLDQLPNMGKNSKHHIQQYFSLEKISKEYLSLICK